MSVRDGTLMRRVVGEQHGLRVKLPIYHTVAKDHAKPYPFATNPHIMITGRYSGSSNNPNKLVFRHVYLAGQATPRDLLHRYRTEVHAAIRKRLKVNMFYTDTLGDTFITVVTKKSEKHHEEWILACDMRV